MKARIAAFNKCFYSLRQIFRSRAISKAVKIKIFKAMVKPEESETWAVSEMDIKIRGTEDRKILRRIYEPVAEQGIWRIRMNQELRELYKTTDIVSRY